MLKRLEELARRRPAKYMHVFSSTSDPRKEVPTRGPSIEDFGRGRPSAVPHSPEAARGCL